MRKGTDGWEKDKNKIYIEIRYTRGKINLKWQLRSQDGNLLYVARAG
jgi:hypothetical protein